MCLLKSCSDRTPRPYAEQIQKATPVDITRLKGFKAFKEQGLGMAQKLGYHPKLRTTRTPSLPTARGVSLLPDGEGSHLQGFSEGITSAPPTPVAPPAAEANHGGWGVLLTERIKRMCKRMLKTHGRCQGSSRLLHVPPGSWVCFSFQQEV